MNQAPTRNKSRHEVNPYINKVGLMNQAPTEEPNPDRNQAPTRNKPLHKETL